MITEQNEEEEESMATTRKAALNKVDEGRLNKK